MKVGFMSHSRKFALILLVFVAAVVVSMHRGRVGPYSESRMLMDTIITIKAYPAESEQAVAAAFAAFEEIENLASFHRSETEVFKLNHTGRLPLNTPLVPLLDICRHYYHFSDGYFDPSFAILQKAYGFYSQEGRLPEDAEITYLLGHSCGFDRVLTVDADNIFLASGSLIDLGGIAGGVAIEKAAKILKNAGCTGFLIDDDGDIWFEGTKPDASLWRIAVRDPRDNGALAIVESQQSLAISTSGDYERFVTVNGKRYGHIMNPLTGRPVDYYSSVTVVASSAIAADALSTSIFAMPAEKAFVWVEKNSVPALFLTSGGEVHVSLSGQQYFKEVKSR